jgi:hypothetical protein
MPNPIGVMSVTGSGQAWYVVANGDQGRVVIAGPFDTQALAQKYLQPPL